jgi:hypothetical protein
MQPTVHLVWTYILRWRSPTSTILAWACTFLSWYILWLPAPVLTERVANLFSSLSRNTAISLPYRHMKMVEFCDSRGQGTIKVNIMV